MVKQFVMNSFRYHPDFDIFSNDLHSFNNVLYKHSITIKLAIPYITAHGTLLVNTHRIYVSTHKGKKLNGHNLFRLIDVVRAR